MDSIHGLGLIAAGLTVFGYIPQVIKSHKSRRLRDLSLGMYIFLLIADITWIIYGYLVNDMAIIVANAIIALMVLYILRLKLKHG